MAGHDIWFVEVNDAEFPDISLAMKTRDEDSGEFATSFRTVDGSLVIVREMPNVGRVVSIEMINEDGIHTPLSHAPAEKRQSIIDQCRSLDRKLLACA